MLAPCGRAQNQPHRLVLALAPIVLLEPGQIEVHLAFVGRGERADLEVDGHQAPQAAMIEEQVEGVIVLIDPHGVLPPDEAEIRPQLGQELLQIVNDGGLQVLLRIRPFEPEEVEDIGVLEDVLIANHLRRARVFLLCHKPRSVPGECHPLKQPPIDLPAELAHRPALFRRLFKVESRGKADRSGLRAGDNATSQAGSAYGNR